MVWLIDLKTLKHPYTMSRSKKKTPIIKQKGIKEYNKIIRRRNKMRIEQGLDPQEINEIVNQWDICDYRFYSPKDETVTRK
jgi:hypothetical protein